MRNYIPRALLIKPEPSVYIIGRNTDPAIITRLGPTIFRNAVPKIHTAIVHREDFVDIRASYLDGSPLFSDEVRRPKASDRLDSQVFDSIEAFMKFIHDGSSSYAPSVYDKYFSRVDLYKEDSNYELLDVTLKHSWLDSVWHEAGLVFDSALRAGGGGLYKWMHLGLNPEIMAEGRLPVPCLSAAAQSLSEIYLIIDFGRVLPSQFASSLNKGHDLIDYCFWTCWLPNKFVSTISQNVRPFISCTHDNNNLDVSMDVSYS